MKRSSSPAFRSGLVKWIDDRLPVFTFMHHELNEYPTPKNLNYWWNFGSLAGITLVIMIVRAPSARACCSCFSRSAMSQLA